MEKNSCPNTVVIGAGPYGLSIAAHLTGRNVPHRVFGIAMHSWRERMPKGMFLKSDGFASSLSSPDAPFTLKEFCAETAQPYHDTKWPIPIQTFVDYCMAFQKRKVPELEETLVTSLKRSGKGFELQTAAGETLHAKNVIIAAGLTTMDYKPPVLDGLPAGLCTHAADHSDLSKFRGKKVTVLGAGSSAVDCAALLHEEGAEVDIIGRRDSIRYNVHHADHKPGLLHSLKYPSSGLGKGWKSKFCCELPLVFRAMPYRLRSRAVARHLGPASTESTMKRMDGHVTQHLGATLEKAEPRDGKLALSIREKDGSVTELIVDHLIAGTGYQATLSLIPYMDAGLRSQIKEIEDRPVLDSYFQCSVKGLYFTGLIAAHNFGPMLRFAVGAGFTGDRIAKHLAKG